MSRCRNSRWHFNRSSTSRPEPVYAQEALVRPPGGGSAIDVLGQVGTRSLYAFDQQCRLKAITLAASLGMRGFLHINFLPNAVYEPADSVQETLDAAERAGFPLDNLVFEVTETERARDSQHLRAILVNTAATA
jgi:EAL domain-containing protein (putative c-di-GMP-specific phosphodiesterase class I)